MKNKASRKNTKLNYDDDEDGYTIQDFKKDRLRKQQKRINYAIKTKNIDALLEYEDEL